MRARDIVGRRIVRVDLNRFPDNRGGWAFDPVFTLDNGARISFCVQETEGGEYGIRPVVHKRDDDRPCLCGAPLTPSGACSVPACVASPTKGD